MQARKTCFREKSYDSVQRFSGKKYSCSNLFGISKSLFMMKNAVAPPPSIFKYIYRIAIQHYAMAKI
jgi:hypothetical protein